MRLSVILLAFALTAAACGGTEDTTTTTRQTTTTTAPETTTTEAAETGEAAGAGVDPETMTIALGALHDLTGPSSALGRDINDAMQVYFDTLNAGGGIQGWMIDYQPLDTNLDPDRHLEQYETLREGVLAIAASAGTATSVAALESMIEDDMTFIPLSWYSGWAIPGFDGGLGLEMNTSYCIEALNLLEYIRDQGGQTIAVVTAPSDDGLDAAAGVDRGAAFYGLEIVYDGRGDVISGRGLSDVVARILESEADWVYVAADPRDTETLLRESVAAGFQGMWTGAATSYRSHALEDPELGPLFDRLFVRSVYNVPWGHNAPGNLAMMGAMAAAYPDRAPSDGFIIGWNAGVLIARVLEDAIGAGDLTREGVARAATQAGIDFQGTAPNQTFAGQPNDYVTRQSAIFDPDLDTFAAAGGAEQTLSQEGGTTGSLLVQDFFASQAAQALDFQQPCYQP